MIGDLQSGIYKIEKNHSQPKAAKKMHRYIEPSINPIPRIDDCNDVQKEDENQETKNKF